jgi:DUF2075 family protein
VLGPQLARRFADRLLYEPAQSEVRSWLNSLPAVAGELAAAGLDDVEVLLEYTLPLTSRRLDVLLLGRRPKAGAISAVVWENKQWTSGDIDSVEERIVTVLGRRLLHPQQQVHSYVEYLTDFNQLAHEGRLQVSGLAFLHNATTTEVAPLRSARLPDLAQYPMFTGDESGRLRTFLTERISSDGAAEAADEFLRARIRPSKQLLQHVQAQIKGHDAFTLLDQQRVALEVVLHAVDESRRSNRKTVVIVTGGPGSGKSVIATAVLGRLASRGYNIAHATGSKSFTTTLRKRVGTRAGNLFRYFNQFGAVERNDMDVLVADEAHRIRISSNSRYTKAGRRSTRPQVDELLQAARVPLFLLDEHQVVRPEEIGTVETIEDAARRNDAEVIRVDLDAHFRCGGSEAYLAWLRRLLGIVPGGPIPWVRDEVFDLRRAASPAELERALKQKVQEGYSARMAAGFCWPWSDPKGDHLVDDVTIGEWRRPWNLKPEKRLKGIPSASLWASDPGGFEQVGCIYTAQGFEYDYSGVIVGPDLVWRESGWVADSSASKDTVVRRATNFSELARHAYRVLLTRGLIGCVIFSVDRETNDLFNNLGVPGVE